MRVQINSLCDKMGEYDWLIREEKKKLLTLPPLTLQLPVNFYIIFFVINKRLAFVPLKTIQQSGGLRRESFLCVHKDEK